MSMMSVPTVLTCICDEAGAGLCRFLANIKVCNPPVLYPGSLNTTARTSHPNAKILHYIDLVQNITRLASLSRK